MTFVIDASVAAAAVLPDEIDPTALEHLGRAAESGAQAPAIFPLEVLNTLVSALRQKRIDKAFLESTLRRLNRTLIVIDSVSAFHPENRTSELALRFQLTAYDAAYLELALRRALPLATLDSRLAEAARAAGVELL